MRLAKLPYGRQCIQDDDVEAVVRALRSDWLTTGPAVDEFEAALSRSTGARFAVAVANGTAALHLACLAAEIGPGDLVISSPITFVASANCAAYVGARPGFVDIDARTYNLDPGALGRLLAGYRGSEKPRAVIPVHFSGQPCDMEAIAGIARGAGLMVIEDACHALGASWQGADGQWHTVGSCSHSDMSVFSFHPVKHITTAEGGAITTNSPELADRLKRLRNHGLVKDPASLTHYEGPWSYEMHDLGMNYRLTDVQCALGVSQLRKLEQWVARRREIAGLYDRLLSGVDGITLPYQHPGSRSSYHLYVVQTPARRAVFEALRSRGIGVQVHYIPVHLQPYYRERYGFSAGDFPVAEQYYRGAISLPIFPAMSDADVACVADELRDLVETACVGAAAAGTN